MNKAGVMASLLKDLEIFYYYPAKITLQDVIQIGGEAKTGKQKVVWDILKKLIRCNRKAISDEISNLSPEESSSSDDDFETISDSKVNQFNPSDVFMAIYTCCDLNLRQILGQKMFQCKLALPFIIPSIGNKNFVFNLWALRVISLLWKTPSEEVIEASAVKHPVKIVSCIRVGTPKLSKSEFLNNIVCGTHDVFIDRNSTHGDIQKTRANGLVECTFVLPCKQNSDWVVEPTLFLNLRGNSTDHEIQNKVLSHISNMVLVVVDVSELGKPATIKTLEQFTNCKEILLVLTNSKQLEKEVQEAILSKCKAVIKENVSLKKMRTYKGNVYKNTADITSKARENICKFLQTSSGSCVEKIVETWKEVISVDEKECLECQKGKELADRVISHHSKNSSKSDLLPLQGHLWHDACKRLKQQKRASDLQRAETHKTEIKQIKKKQAEKGLSIFMKCFLDGLTETINSQSPDQLGFYMQWLKFHFDEVSRQTLPALQQRYADLANKEAGTDESLATEDENEKIDIQNRISESTFGIEHLLREMGQIYEANHISGEESHTNANLPDLAARLIIDGNSFELMDGDAPGLPLTWVNAVFGELKKKLGNKEVFCLSVLGVQSSGKSTLLNTMFGLQFPVSAGRCTKGVYMQLLKVHESSSLPFRYVAVLDSEGLGAQELCQDQEKYNRDNELATFIIGLGDITLINVKGEHNVEIKDILQIVAHAFLRMMQINRSIQKDRSCFFIHQNVTAVNARQQIRVGLDAFFKTLDEATVTAAKSENIVGIHSFKDVIHLDSTNQICYFPGLWFGNPPNATVSIDYSDHVNDLKQQLFKSKKNDSWHYRISDLGVFISDLWLGVLSDDFIFNFQNSLAIMAYTKLDQKYAELKWEIELSLRKEASCYKWISNGVKGIKEQCELLKVKVTQLRETKIEESVTKLHDFIAGGKNSQIMIEWTKTKEISLRCVSKTIAESVRSQIDRKANRESVILVQNKEKDRHKEEIMNKAHKLADELRMKDELDQATRDLKFNEMWHEWWKQINLHQNDTDLSIADRLTNLLYDQFPNDMTMVKKVLGDGPLLPLRSNTELSSSFNMDELDDTDVSTKKRWHEEILNWKSQDDKERIKSHIGSILEEANSVLSNLSCTDIEFDIHNAQQLVQSVRNPIRNKNANSNETVSIHKCLEVKLVVHVLRYSLPNFQRMQVYYETNESVSAHLKAYKQKLSKFFNECCEEATNEISMADIIADEVTNSLKTETKKEMEHALFAEIVPHFITKSKLIKAVLVDLAEKEKFSDFSKYTLYPKKYIQEWLVDYIKEFVLRTERGENWYFRKARTYVREHISQAKQIITSITIPPDCATFDTWMSLLTGRLTKVISFQCNRAKSFAKGKDFNLEKLQVRLSKVLDGVSTELLESFLHLDVNNIKWNNPPQDQILNSLWGCESLCPFCKEPCISSDPNHASPNDCHRVIQHRPKGVALWVKILSGKIVIENCSFAVQSSAMFRCAGTDHKCDLTEHPNDVFHPYRDYKKYVPEWEIPPSADMESTKYWMWYMCMFKQELADVHNSKLPDIPPSWMDITKGSAIQSLSVYDCNDKIN